MYGQKKISKSERNQIKAVRKFGKLIDGTSKEVGTYQSEKMLGQIKHDRSFGIGENYYDSI